MPFPLLPNNNVYQPPTSNVNTVSSSIDLHNADETYPSDEDDYTGSVDSPTYTYHVAATNEKSIDMTGNHSLTLGKTGKETIVLYLDGDWRGTGNGGIQLY